MFRVSENWYAALFVFITTLSTLKLYLVLRYCRKKGYNYKIKFNCIQWIWLSNNNVDKNSKDDIGFLIVEIVDKINLVSKLVFTKYFSFIVFKINYPTSIPNRLSQNNKILTKTLLSYNFLVEKLIGPINMTIERFYCNLMVKG